MRTARSALKTLTAGTAVAAVAALTLGLAGPAHAQGVTVSDPDDSSHGSDILSAKIAHTENDVVVLTTHDDLVRGFAHGSGGAIYLDTDPDDPGPEFVLVGGYYVGTDYTLVATEGFRTSQWGEPVQHGDYIQKVRYGSDKVRTMISRAALGNPDQVRVSIKASGNGEGTVDWVGAPRSFSAWLSPGTVQG